MIISADFFILTDNRSLHLSVSFIAPFPSVSWPPLDLKSLATALGRRTLATEGTQEGTQECVHKAYPHQVHSSSVSQQR
jgi:hypothetical protein